MKSALYILPALILAAPAAAQSQADIDGVRAAVMAYVEAGDTGTPERAFEAFETETGTMFVRRPGDEETPDHVTTMALADLAARYTRASGDRGAIIRDIRIVEGVMAFAHVSMAWDDRELDDMFLLYKLEDEWKIVAKTVVFH